MKAKIVKVRDIEGKKVEIEGQVSLKGNIVVLNPEQSEIAKNLGITEKGSYATRT